MKVAYEDKLDACMRERKRMGSEIEALTESLRLEKEQQHLRDAERQKGRRARVETDELRVALSRVQTECDALKERCSRHAREGEEMQETLCVERERVGELQVALRKETACCEIVKLSCSDSIRETQGLQEQIVMDRKAMSELQGALNSAVERCEMIQRDSERKESAWAQKERERQGRERVALKDWEKRWADREREWEKAGSDEEMRRRCERERAERDVESAEKRNAQKAEEEKKHAVRTEEVRCQKLQKICDELKEELRAERVQAHGLEKRLGATEVELGGLRVRYDSEKEVWEERVREVVRAGDAVEQYKSEVQELSSDIVTLRMRLEREVREAGAQNNVARRDRNVAEGLRRELLEERKRSASLHVALTEEKLGAEALRHALDQGKNYAAELRVRAFHQSSFRASCEAVLGRCRV